VTPGRTAPDASFTVPVTVPSTCAVLTDGVLASPRARSRIAGYRCRAIRIVSLRRVRRRAWRAATGQVSDRAASFCCAKLSSRNAATLRLGTTTVKAPAWLRNVGAAFRLRQGYGETSPKRFARRRVRRPNESVDLDQLDVEYHMPRGGRTGLLATARRTAEI